MIGVLFSFLESLFTEVSTISGKSALIRKEESRYSYIFVTMFAALIILSVVSYLTHEEFRLSIDSFPFLFARVLLEICLVIVSVDIVSKVDRVLLSTAKVLTLPLIAIFDIFIGGGISTLDVIAIGVICAFFIALLKKEHFSAKLIPEMTLIVILPVFTISIYRYDITHFNSLFAEQCVVFASVALFAFVSDITISKENPFRVLKHPLVFVQAVSSGSGTLVASYAYLFGSASVITSLRKSVGLIGSYATDVLYYKRKLGVLEYVAGGGVIFGVVLLVLF